MTMRRSLADAILKSYAEFAEPNLPSDLPDNHPVQILVNFRLGDLRSLKRTLESVDRMAPPRK